MQKQILAEQPAVAARAMSQAAAYSSSAASRSPDRHSAATAPARGTGRSLELIVERVQAEFPSMMKETILGKIEIVRRNNNGTIKGLTMAKLVDQIRMLNQGRHNLNHNFQIIDQIYVLSDI
jgi:hypothetical protein